MYKMALLILQLQDDVDPAREAYDAFFGYYPYCYGYWKKYADLEKRHNDLTKAVEVRAGIKQGGD